MLDHSDEQHFPKPDKRTETDLACCSWFTACVLGACVLATVSGFFGDSRRLTHGFQWDGRLCGVDPGVEQKPFIYYCGSSERDGDYPVALNYQSTVCVSVCPADATTQLECLMPATILPNNSALACPEGDCSTVIRTTRISMVQVVQLQPSYPSQAFRGRFCVPLYQDGSTLRDDLINGPLSHADRFLRLLASAEHGWPLVLLAVVLSASLGFLYLHCMRVFAGCTIFLTMCGAACVVELAGLFFLLALFFNASDETGTYEKINPLMRSFWGWEAKLYSMLIGIALIVYGIALAYSAHRTMPKIDEAVGLVEAACDCIFTRKFDLYLEPFVKAALGVVHIIIAGAGLVFICSVGYIDDAAISVNGDPVPGLLKTFRWYPGWPILVALYVAVCIWLWGVMSGRFHFAVAYAVCIWYFSVIEKTVDNSPDVVKEVIQVGRKVPMTVSGMAGGHKAWVKKNPDGTSLLVAPMGGKNPAGENYPLGIHELKKVPRFSCCKGSLVAFAYHMGSLAHGAVIGALTWPCRTVNLIWKAVANREEFDEEEHKKDVFFVFMSLLDEAYGPYGNGAYADMVLTGSPFMVAATNHYRLAHGCGGAVSFLFGSCSVYRSVAVAAITVIVTVCCFLLVDTCDMFSNPANDQWYVADAFGLSCICGCVAFSVAHGCVALFAHTCDTLLYVFAWARHHRMDVSKTCPWTIRNILGDEMDEEPHHSLSAHGGPPKMNNFWHAVRKYGPTGHKLGTIHEQEPLVSAERYKPRTPLSSSQRHKQPPL